MRFTQSLPPMLPESFVTLGGFTWVKPEIWCRYLTAVTRTHFPRYAILRTMRSREDLRWKENDCIFSSLSKYLLSSFGFIIPEDSLFKYFNRRGEGVMPADIIDAIRAVIEPLGFQIDQVLVPDPDLRKGMGHREFVVDLSHAAEFHRRAGLCMINVREGYSHAFFWKEMDQARFAKEQFRLAVTVKPKYTPGRTHPSTVRCFEDYVLRLESALPGCLNAPAIRTEIACAADYIDHLLNCQNQEAREPILHSLQIIRGLLQENEKSSPGEIGFLVETGRMVERILRESEILQ